MFSFDTLKKKAKARRSQRPTTPPSPGSFFTSPRSPRWATRSTSSDTSSNYPIPPVPSLPPPLPEVMSISAPPMPRMAPPVAPDSRRPSTSTSSTAEQSNPRLDLGFHPGASSSSLTDWFPGGMAPVSATPSKGPQSAHKKVPSLSARSNAPSDVLSPNSLFSASSTLVSSPSTTVAGSYPNATGSALGKEPRRTLAFNASDPILPTFSTESRSSPSPSRRAGAVPTPIRIPDGSLHHPAVQVDRSASPGDASTPVPSKPVAGPPPEPSPPPSPGTAHDAYLASAFVLSGDRTNDPAWNSAGLTRMDSATLPRDSFVPSTSLSKLRGPRPIRTNSRRQSLAPTLRRSSSAAALLPGTPGPGSRSTSSSPQPQSQPSSSPGMPTFVVQGADGAKRRISAITEISSAGSVYSFPDESASALRPDPTSRETLPSLTTGPSAESLVSDATTEDEDRARGSATTPRSNSDDRPVLDQVWEFLLPDGSRAGTPRTGSTSTPSPFPESRVSPQSAQGSRSTAPTTAANSPSPRTKYQKPSMLNLQDPPKRSSVKRKSVELVQDSTPESPEFGGGGGGLYVANGRSGGKGKEPAPSVPHTAVAEDPISPGPSTSHRRGHQRAPSDSTLNTVTGAQSSSHGHSGHSSTGSNAQGVLYLSFKKDPGSVPSSLSHAGALFPETPRSFEQSFSPAAVGQTFTVEVAPVHKSRSRVPTLPIGPRTGVPHIRTDGATSVMRDASGRGGAHAKRPSTTGAAAARNPLPPSPKFNTAPIRWKGLTYDAARWTLSSAQLQEIVTRAIKYSAESSSIRLLQPDVVEDELPAEMERLTRQREDLRARLKQQIRTRRVLLRKLTAPDAHGVAKHMAEIMDACAVCDQLSEELFHVSDQLAQMARLRDVHQASALSMALRKINTSFVRVTSEAVELQKRVSTLEAEREEAWHTAESVEQELNEARAKLAKQTAGCKCDTDGEDHAPSDHEPYSRPSSRVSAARKTSMRASKASLRLSARKSRTSVASSRMFSPDSAYDVPPVPPMPLTTSPLAALTDFHNASKARQSIGAGSFVSSIQSPTPEGSALAAAQAELLELLGITMNDITGNRSSGGSGSSGPRRRPRSASDAAAQPHPSPAFLDAPGQFSPQPSPRWTVAAGSPMVDAFGQRLRRSLSEYTSKRAPPRPDSMLLSPPRDGAFPARISARSLLEDPDSLLALMTRAASSNESSPLPGHTFKTGRTYI